MTDIEILNSKLAFIDDQYPVDLAYGKNVAVITVLPFLSIIRCFQSLSTGRQA